ncbi:putative glycosyltransferase, exosortase G system-associated [Caproiciproducens galactitolivorans]|uniref:Poly-beta-1,6-N-acetyl-D-glucosamine synthase n=1 Tax=Caproiciproducens galactitolivorans TaxID=642589 RepID=A0A4Z0YF73_9FIRM|nr:TIGR03111 family XrtG-associated glycosyltransferase [Caproiciproducens galactitolivorans]QEY35692.1 putative glycosyltransferase, exosortase G system-associated [Caproiciproducens galactitolivorans]TGJ77423.1 poly-beta-1,6-N-acetyl-D-glucosamine synthase [Caproiciproducens galactitolivorans]
MLEIIKFLSSQFIFWLAWIFIPLVMEGVPSVISFFLLLKKGVRQKKEKNPILLPEISLIIPVYNSSDTLEACLESVYHSNYPLDLIDILLVNNKSTDDSFLVYQMAQAKFPKLSMQWLNAKQGKSKALNMALYNSEGKYIIHIDSDGKLHPDALKNIVVRFENNLNIHCMTGSILTDPDLINQTKGPLKRLFRKLEFMEYCQAFLVGRNFEAELNSIFTLSGAFSAFRKSTILKTQLYNTDTVSEDTHVTFQVRKLLKQKVYICENAFFLVDPIEDFNKLYVQRQRWQRGELEVAHMFHMEKFSLLPGFFSNFMVRLLLFDHTFVFPRMIWYFALIFLAFWGSQVQHIVTSVLILYCMYVLTTFLFYLNVNIYFSNFPEYKSFYRSKFYLIFLLPLYNFIVFWIRVAGIINSIKGHNSWRTSNITEEFSKFRKVVRSDLFVFSCFFIHKQKRVRTMRKGEMKIGI